MKGNPLRSRKGASILSRVGGGTQLERILEGRGFELWGKLPWKNAQAERRKGRSAPGEASGELQVNSKKKKKKRKKKKKKPQQKKKTKKKKKKTKTNPTTTKKRKKTPPTPKKPKKDQPLKTKKKNTFPPFSPSEGVIVPSFECFSFNTNRKAKREMTLLMEREKSVLSSLLGREVFDPFAQTGDLPTTKL